MYNIGKNVDLAVKIIYSASKRYLFRKKLYKYKLYYELVMAKREAKVMEKLVNCSHVMFSRFHIKTLKFLRMRNRKLRKIKRKLAILQIKKIVRREHISLKNLKVSIKKYKRRISLMLAMSSSKAQEVENKPLEHEEKKASVESEDEEDRMNKVRLIMEMEEKRRKKIDLGKIAYKVPKLHKIHLFPRLKKQKSNSSSESSADNEHKEKKVLKLSDFDPKPKKAIRANKYKNIISNYMDPTLSFSIGLKGPDWLYEKKERQNKFFQGNKTVMTPTKFSLQKIRQKKVSELRTKPS